MIFSDSHIKFKPNWLEPLLVRLLSYESEEANPRLLVLSPFISAFTEDGLDYPAAEYLRGGFNWDLTFTWEPMSEEEKDVVSEILFVLFINGFNFYSLFNSIGFV